VNKAAPGVDHQVVRAPHALPAVFAVLGSASLAGCSHVIDAAIDAVANGRGHHTWFVVLHSPVTYFRVLILLGVATLAIVSCAGWWLVGWMRWRRALRAARPATSVPDSVFNPPKLMRSRQRKEDR
jgi:hypothetical protein